MLKFRRTRVEGDSLAARLYNDAVVGSRQPILYSAMGVPDTAEGRFELLTVYVVLVIERLNHGGARGRAAAQSLFDIYLRNLDGALREMGVSDLAVGKRMKSLGQIFYGRATAYGTAFDSTDSSALEALICRTILMEASSCADAGRLALYLRHERDRLASIDVQDLLLETRS